MKFVTGNLLYKTGYDYQANEEVTISLLGKKFKIGIDSINNQFVSSMLTTLGIPASKIIAVGGFGSSQMDTIEIFFAYEGSLPKPRMPFGVQNGHHYYESYIAEDAIIIPAYAHIKPGLDSAALKIAKDYNVLSFMIKTHALQALPQLILSRSPKDGVLADMRNIPGSHAYVVDFKKLNWGRIWYQDTSGKQKVVVRPAGGWVI